VTNLGTTAGTAGIGRTTENTAGTGICDATGIVSTTAGCATDDIGAACDATGVVSAAYDIVTTVIVIATAIARSTTSTTTGSQERYRQ
jgi:hypothetical protein